MANKPKANENLANDVETPKLKHIDIPAVAKVEISRMTQNLDIYISGVAAGLGVKGKWSFNVNSMQLIVES